ncbi:protein-tyrosine-phosphatase [Chryseobacterium sp.]|uniref:protein-tyrosine-phosphatase n=1 Tax=Chryseobacterium sp. TaxID=1871047 RepID=UPI00262C9574|nr:protein-tyrosine-phosphatase [Chryseobacterium sp.]
MNVNLSKTIQKALFLKPINEDRKKIVQPLIEFIQKKVTHNEAVNISFICTHNSRRSHFSQIWAQVAAAHFGIANVFCYSGGTEETALFPKVAETLIHQGFIIFKISENDNPVYAIKYDENAFPVIGFSKKYDSLFNPDSGFAAVITCSQADDGCPFIAGAEVRIPITYEDPKYADNLPVQEEVYHQRSLEIASEMLYVFSMIKK